MDNHKNARLTIHSREQIAKRVLEQGLTLKLATASFNVSAKTAAKFHSTEFAVFSMLYAKAQKLQNL